LWAHHNIAHACPQDDVDNTLKIEKVTRPDGDIAGRVGRIGAMMDGRQAPISG
jgi:hypothetical protein